jgi:hypothetical protein
MLRTNSKRLAESLGRFDLCHLADIARGLVNAASGHVENSVGTTGTYIGTRLAPPAGIQEENIMGVVNNEKREHHVSVFGLFRDEDTLARAIDALRTAGFAADDISALLPDARATRELAHEKHTKAPEGAAAGTAAGVVAGGTMGWLLGIGAIAIPGLGMFFAAGPIMAALAGAGVGAAAGSLTGALIGMGIPEYEAKRYESFINDGGMLVSVHCRDKDMQKRARALLDGFGGHDVADKREASGKDVEDVKS